MLQNTYFLTGLVALVLSAFLLLVGIPYGVTSPSNVPNIVLSPVFWPNVISVILAVSGLGLMLSARGVNRDETNTKDAPNGGYKRLAILAVMMVLYMLAIPTIGMVWASMAAFIVLALLIHSEHRVAAVMTAIAVPLLLYAFFAYVAGVAIPQGELVRLP